MTLTDAPIIACYAYHLGVIIPEGDCAIKADAKKRGWQAGGRLIFDHSYEHEAWNNIEAGLWFCSSIVSALPPNGSTSSINGYIALLPITNSAKHFSTTQKTLLKGMIIQKKAEWISGFMQARILLPTFDE